MMRTPTNATASFLPKMRGFLFGLIFGVVLTGTGSTLWADEDGDSSFRKKALYALAQLAIDSERNAINIVELRERVDDLETILEENPSGKN